MNIVAGATDLHAYDVFVSAHGRDFDVARELQEECEGWGLKAFFCESTAAVLGTASFTAMIGSALDAATHFLFVASPPVPGAAAISGWCQAEIDAFINERNSGRKKGNFCSVLLGNMNVADLPLWLRTGLAFPHANRADLRPFLGARSATHPSGAPIPLKHPLHEYPLGPLVPPERFPPGLITHCATIFRDPTDADLARERANFERTEANPEGDPEKQCVLAYEVMAPAHASALAYWNQVLRFAGLKSPRMVGAFLEDLDFNLIREPARKQVERFRDQLKKWPIATSP